jgi:hypothetical protein
LQGFALRRLVKIYGVGGADLFAGPAFLFLDVNAAVAIDAIFQGHRLGVFDIGGLAFDDPCVIGIFNCFNFTERFELDI